MSGNTSAPISSSTAPPPRMNWGAPVVATVSVVELIIFAALAVWLKNNDLLLLIGGAITANATTAVGYYLGSSHSSAQKDAVIAANLPTLPPK